VFQWKQAAPALKRKHFKLMLRAKQKKVSCLLTAAVVLGLLVMKQLCSSDLAIVQLVEGRLVGEELPHLHVQHAALSVTGSIRE
jgi:hypothetical protein